MNALGLQGDLSEDGPWEVDHIDVALGLLCGSCGRLSSGAFPVVLGLSRMWVAARWWVIMSRVVWFL